jgi:hypothetical protein
MVAFVACASGNESGETTQDCHLRPRAVRSRRSLFPHSSRDSPCFRRSPPLCTPFIQSDSRRSEKKLEDATKDKPECPGDSDGGHPVLRLPRVRRKGGQPITGGNSPPSFSRAASRCSRAAIRSVAGAVSPRRPDMDSGKAPRLLVKLSNTHRTLSEYSGSIGSLGNQASGQPEERLLRRRCANAPRTGGHR